MRCQTCLYHDTPIFSPVLVSNVSFVVVFCSLSIFGHILSLKGRFFCFPASFSSHSHTIFLCFWHLFMVILSLLSFFVCYWFVFHLCVFFLLWLVLCCWRIFSFLFLFLSFFLLVICGTFWLLFQYPISIFHLISSHFYILGYFQWSGRESFFQFLVSFFVSQWFFSHFFAAVLCLLHSSSY